MDPVIISALSAVLGSIVGGTATLATTWISLHTQGRREMISAEIRKRETLYAEFIDECGKLAIDALDRTLDDTSILFHVYALQNRIKLSSSDAVVAATDQVIKLILKQYFKPNLTKEQFRDLVLSPTADPLKPFSAACRKELETLQRGI